MNILIVGAGGYIGRHFLYSAKKHASCYVMNRESISSLSFSGESIVYDYNSLPQVLNLYKFDVIINFATEYYGSDPSKLVDSNIKLPLILLEYLKIHKGVYINIGSYWEWSLSVKKVAGVNPYGILKASVSHLLNYYRAYGINCIDVKLYGVYGENDHRKKIIDIIIDAARREREIELSAGEQILNLVHVDDVVNTLNDIIKSNSSANDAIAIASNKEYKLKEIVAMVDLIKKVKISKNILSYRDDEVMKPVYPEHGVIYVQDRVQEYITNAFKSK